MKPILVGAVIAVAVVLVSVTSNLGRAQTQSRPIGVSEEDWVPISDTAGVILGDVVSYSSRSGSPTGLSRLSGTLVVLRNDSWIIVETAADLTPRLLPLH